MKTKLLDKSGKSQKEIELPKNFSSTIRKDILLKYFESQKSIQPYGAKIGAGAGYSASGIIRRRRNVWKTSYGKGISRVPRKIMSRSGASFNWVGATVASTVGGRKAHAPRVIKNQKKKINKKEILMAFNSAFTGTFDSKSLEKKYQDKINGGFVFEDSILKLKTKEFLGVLKNIFEDSFDRILKKKEVRSGKGKLRGRKYKSNAGLLFVISKDETMKRSGIDVVKTDEILISDLTPNGEPGRITCYTEKAIKEIGERFK